MNQEVVYIVLPVQHCLVNNKCSIIEIKLNERFISEGWYWLEMSKRDSFRVLIRMIIPQVYTYIKCELTYTSGQDKSDIGLAVRKLDKIYETIETQKIWNNSDTEQQAEKGNKWGKSYNCFNFLPIGTFCTQGGEPKENTVDLLRRWVSEFGKAEEATICAAKMYISLNPKLSAQLCMHKVKFHKVGQKQK